MKSMQSNDSESVMETIHSQSPAYLETLDQLESLFQNYVLSYELLDFSFIGLDGDYAFARITQKTLKVKGPAFQNNVIDMIQIFKKENLKWKIWTQALLEVGFAD